LNHLVPYNKSRIAVNYNSETNLHVRLFRLYDTFGNGPTKFGIFKSFGGSDGAVGKVENLTLAGLIFSAIIYYGVMRQ